MNLRTVISIVAGLILLLSGSCESDKEDIQDFGDLSVDSLKIITIDIPGDRYTDIAFINSNTGYAVSNSGSVIKTENGGLNWVTLESKVSFYLVRIQFTDTQTGYITGGDASGGYLLKTTDAGMRWVLKNISTPDKGIPTGMFFLDNRTGFITGKKLFIRTSDGGETWSDVIGNTDRNINDVNFRSSLQGYATSDDGIFLKTADAGKTWQTVQSGVTEHLKRIYFATSRSYANCQTNQFIDLETGKKCFKAPEGSFRFLFIDDLKCVGIGQHYEGGYFPYGDVFLTNDSWANFTVKKFSPQSEAMDVTAIARPEERRVIMTGFGMVNQSLIELRF